LHKHKEEFTDMVSCCGREKVSTRDKDETDWQLYGYSKGK